MTSDHRAGSMGNYRMTATNGKQKRLFALFTFGTVQGHKRFSGDQIGVRLCEALK